MKREVLKLFKDLHRARIEVFKGDNRALEAAREKINLEFKKNKNVPNSSSIEELMKFTIEVTNELKRTIIQAVEVEPGSYRLHIRPETEMLKNMPFNPNVEIPKRGRKATKCCQEVKDTPQKENT